MARIKAGDIQLGCREWGSGSVPVLFIHGNLANKDWLELAAHWLPSDLRVIGIDWRGCGDSDRPAPVNDYENYSFTQHADDMLAALDTLGVERCHLITHSTGAIIGNRMQLKQPERFGKVLALNPVSPLKMRFDAQGMGLVRSLHTSREATKTVMESPAKQIFNMPWTIKDGVDHLQSVFTRLMDETTTVGEGVWMGTPVNLSKEAKSGELAARLGELVHDTLVVWGEQDQIIDRRDLEPMVAAMPNARLTVLPGVGHSMMVEQPQMFAAIAATRFSGVPL